MRKVLSILGVPIDDLADMGEAMNRLDEFVTVGRRSGKSHQIATVNADFVVKAQHNPELQRILRLTDLATADGMPLVWGARLMGIRLAGRVTGADMVPALARHAAEKGYSIFFLGAAPGVARRAADRLQSEYPQLKIAGVYSPDKFNLVETALDRQEQHDRLEQDMMSAIKAANPDILLVAFGNPKQEIWIREMIDGRKLRVPVMIGVGGTFDFLAGITRRAPVWMQRSGLEWVYRLAQEPRRLWKRYVVDLFSFSVFYMREWPSLRRRSQPAAIYPSSDAVIDNSGEHRTAVLHVRDRLDAATAPQFEEQAIAALRATPRLVIDLREAKFLDSRGIGCLVGLAKQAREAGGGLAIAAAPPPILRVLALTKLDQFLKARPTVDEASAALDETRHDVAAEPMGADWSVLKMPPQLDATNAPDVIETGDRQLARRPRLVLDFASTTYLSSAGLAAIVRLSRSAAEKGGEVRLAGCKGDVLQVMRLVRFDKLYTPYTSVGDAIAGRRAGAADQP